MGEDRDRNRDRDRDRKETKMARAEEERKAVGLTPDEVREINRSKSVQEPVQGVALNKKVNRAVNAAAALAITAGGVGLAGVAEEALKSTPPARVEEVKPDPKRDNPPEEIRLDIV